MDKLITSRSNQKIRYLRSLSRSKRRHSEGVYMVEGIRLVEEACRIPGLVQEVYVCKRISEHARGRRLLQDFRKNEIPVMFISNSVGDAISDTQNPQGIFSLIKKNEASDEFILTKPSFLGVLLLDVQDPGNLGSVLRVSEAFGAGGIFYTLGGVDPFQSKVARSSMGSLFRIPIARVFPKSIINKCRQKKIQIITAELRAKKNFRAVNYKKPSLLIFGQEGSGLPTEISKLGDECISIPINPSVESLNVAMAASIILHEAAFQRGS